MTVRYRGGPECWWEILARGRTYRVPGHLAVHDAMKAIWEGDVDRRRSREGR